MSENALAWVGSFAGFEPLLEANAGTSWFPEGGFPSWTAAPSPAEAAVGADFVFVSAVDGSWRPSLAKGVVRSAPAGSCIVLLGEGEADVSALANELDGAGLDCLDLALLPAPVRIAVGGDRDTFNLLKPDLQLGGKLVYCGAVGSARTASEGEAELIALRKADRLARLQDLFRAAEEGGAFPQALRNLWKAGPLASPDFDAEADRLTRRS